MNRNIELQFLITLVLGFALLGIWHLPGDLVTFGRLLMGVLHG